MLKPFALNIKKSYQFPNLHFRVDTINGDNENFYKQIIKYNFFIYFNWYV